MLTIEGIPVPITVTRTRSVGHPLLSSSYLGVRPKEVKKREGTSEWKMAKMARMITGLMDKEKKGIDNCGLRPATTRGVLVWATLHTLEDRFPEAKQTSYFECT